MNVDATAIVEEAFDAIAADPVASIVSDALVAAWNGREFDEDVLRVALGAVTEEEAP